MAVTKGAVFAIAVFFTAVFFTAAHLPPETAALLRLRATLSANATAAQCCRMSIQTWGLPGHDACRWEGVDCDDDGHVIGVRVTWTCENSCLCRRCPTGASAVLELASLSRLRSLSLRNLGLGGVPLPFSELCGLRNITYLDLAGNSFTGSLDPCFPSLQHLDLSENALTGPIPSSIGDLVNLQYLDLTGNQINGTLPPTVGNLTSLLHLSLSNNLLQGTLPPSIGNLHLLQNFSLSNNQMEGSIPPSLSGLASLQMLRLSNNKFVGDIPSNLSNLRSLKELDLSGNKLNGTIPPSVGELQCLQRISLSYNQLHGSIHPSLGKLVLLQYLNASSNRLQGTIPPSLGNMSSLQTLDLSNNKFNGTFIFATFANLSNLTGLHLSGNEGLAIQTDSPSWTPSFQLTALKLSHCNLAINYGFPRFLATQKESLMTLDLSKTNLGGSIPSWLFNITTIKGLRLFYLHDNFFNGSLSLPIVIQDLRYLDLSNNLITGIPKDIGLLLPSLWYLNLSVNSLSGRIPSSIGNLKNIGILDLSFNKYSGEIPPSMVSGMANLATLRLSNNKLNGSFLPPGQPSNLLGLESLHLDNNMLTGTIPNELLRSPLLKVLDLGHNHLTGGIPNWVSGLSNLRILILKSNGFHGSIPNEVCHLQNLAMLDLSQNDLQGLMPRCFYNVTAWVDGTPKPHTYGLKQLFNYIEEVGFADRNQRYNYMGVVLSVMTGIDLSKNRLNGDIPEELGSLDGLHTLNISRNSLTGEIPKSFQGLRQIESLDLSYNQLSGAIPHELVLLNTLAVFSVANNHFAGKIPVEGQFFSFNKSSYDDNPDLCGYPLERNCTNYTTRDEGDEEEEEEETSWIDGPLVYYFFVGLCYTSGFWGCLGLLFFNGNLKKALFEDIDTAISFLLYMAIKFKRFFCPLGRSR
ncbi:LRR receptor-like serine/threonine-protein kinase GSO1 [Amborella trichopoda]|uniref:Disease resistance R13L4/SHOC-2-like LRR domain-containing protein n=1 Tax=Amborella trichopoda TaxID=13333 RepID=W1PR03_AMBTC|nr:LRR receptor-like serine/threonine-protein kinase GSO1 [Amborella trichopoda]ERN10493.1 hypothetical protein AMTR_s00161p00068540 [Amborella trichopoda]|eukprot:XP_006848912.1 LRR receptor-like serine/threonine-protein kinase GSO1 [Amborella trichopoda]